MNSLLVKVDFENCWTETSSSYGTGTFIVISVEGEYHIANAGKYNS